MLGRGLPGDGATGCCAVHLSPIVTVLFCLVCALDCVTGEVRRSNQPLSNGLRAPAGGKNRGSACRGKGKGNGKGNGKGKGKAGAVLAGVSQVLPTWDASWRAAGPTPGRKRSLPGSGRNLGQFGSAGWLYPRKRGSEGRVSTATPRSVQRPPSSSTVPFTPCRGSGVRFVPPHPEGGGFPPGQAHPGDPDPREGWGGLQAGAGLTPPSCPAPEQP